MSKTALTNFEKNMAKLQNIVAAMDNPENSLANSLKSYQDGIKLIAECQAALQEVERVIEQTNPDGSKEAFNFDDDAN